MKSLSIATLITGLTITALAVAGNRTQEYKLDNGLELIVQEDHRAPVAVVQVWYRVGSSYEYDGITGVSHALEHMMFKRTDKYDDNHFSKVLEESGAPDLNAWTWLDITAYHVSLPKAKLGLIIVG